MTNCFELCCGMSVLVLLCMPFFSDLRTKTESMTIACWTFCLDLTSFYL